MRRQGENRLTIQEMCQWAKVSRATYHRWSEQSAPREADTALREALQRHSLAHRVYGHRRIRVLLVQEGFVVSKRRVCQLMREDNLLCVRRRKYVLGTSRATTRMGSIRIWRPMCG